MKQLFILIMLVLLALGIYILHIAGFFTFLTSTAFKPRTFVADIKSAVAESKAPRPAGALPNRAPERSCKISMPVASFNALEKAAFADNNYKTALAFVELVYGSGFDGADKLITRYLAAFEKPQEREPVLALVSKHRDIESLNILEKFFIQGTFARKTVLRKVAAFKSPEAADVFIRAFVDPNPVVRETADELFDEFQNEPWFAAAAQKRRDLQGKYARDLYDMPVR